MGLFEYLFERKNPGKVGNINKNETRKQTVNIPSFIIKLVISVLCVSWLFKMIVLPNFTLQGLLVFVIILFVYCFISYWIIPRPDYSNVGLLGGLIDHPFRFTDDLNRFLIFMLILLFPGRFVATSMVELVIVIKNLFNNK